jgi:hypothetical protein
VASRLSRARDVLRGRLTRRGLTLPAAALAASLNEAIAPAAVPLALVQSTIQAAALLPAAKALAAGAISVPVASLAQGMLRTMFISKLKVAALIAVVLAVFGTGTGAVAYRMLTASPVDVPGEPLAERLPDGPEKPRVSKAVVKDGLSVTIQPTKAVFGKDEEPCVEFIFTNVSQRPFKLARMNYFPEGQAQKADLQDVRTGQSWKGTYLPAPRAASPAPLAADLAPEQSLKCAAGLFAAPWGSWRWQAKDNGPVLQTLPPGKYRLTFQLALQAGFQGKKEDYWAGEMTTSPTELEIVDKLAGVAMLKDGLSVTVVTDKDYYARGERPTVTIAFQNATDKPMTFHNPAHAVRSWTFAFADLKRKVKWEGRYPAAVNALPPEKLAAGVSSGLNVDFHELEYRAVDADQPRTVKELPPGRYRLTITVNLDELPAAQFPNAWSGKIRANPVEFEITAK